MSEQTGAENMNFLDSLVLEPPSLSMDKLEEISPVLAELTPKAKATNTKPARRGRKRNADKITTSGTTTTSSTGSGENNVVSMATAGTKSAIKPKRGRGRPAGSTNRSSNKLSAQAATTTASTTTSADGSEVVDQNDPLNAARERSRVKTLRDAFLELQRSLPSVPPDTKLSKLDVLVLATTYISHLMRTLDDDDQAPLSSPGEDVTGCLDKHHRLKAQGYLHPVKKWPMRSRLYAGASADCLLESSS